MATVVIEHNITRVEPFNGAAAGTIVSDPGGGPGAGEAAGLQYEGAESLTRRINATGSDHGFFYIDGSRDMTAAGLTTCFAKSYTVLTDINSHRFRMGLTEPINFEWMLKDDGTYGDNQDYLTPALGGYIVLPIEARVAAWITEPEQGTTTDITAIEGFGVIYNVGTTTGAGLSSSMDAIDLTDDGLFLTRGDSTDPDGSFQFFINADEGALVSGAERVGMFQVRDTIIYAFAKHTIGATDAGSTANPTVFVDSNKTIVFPGGYVGPGFNGFILNMTNASTDIDWTGITIIGRGRTDKKVYFDTELDVDGTLEEITILGHGLNTGDQVAYSAEGGTEDIGPDAATGQADHLISTGFTTGDNWYIRKVDDDTISLHPTMTDALNNLNESDLTASSAGNGENHSLRRQPDTRPDLDGVGTGGTVDLLACILTNLRNIVLTSGFTLDTCQMIAGQSVTLASGTINDCVIDSPTVPIGEAYLTAATVAELANVDDNSFISGGEGHAIEITTTGGTQGFVGNTFSGYGPGGTDDAGVHDNEFDTITDVDDAAELITIAGDPFVTGDPVYYEDGGGTDTIGLTDGDLYYVNRDSASTYSFHLTKSDAVADANPIGLTDGSTGEAHTIYSANAAFVNSTGGTITLQVSGGGTAPSIRNVGANSVTITENNVALTFTGMKDNTEVRVFAAGTTNELAGIENATDGSSDDRSVTFSLAASISVDVRFAQGQAADGLYYLVPPADTFSITWPTLTTDLPVTQVLDRTFNNPA